ncbi:MAG TPA: hypothetical protein VKU89_00270 [Solirubrobacteraceae bacterium]|nr:hypothetical protein [Solirubrobacteraceae bacterium]
MSQAQELLEGALGEHPLSCRGTAHDEAEGARERGERPRTLARYLRADGALRELLVRAGFQGSRLVLDRDALSHGDPRVVAHLAPDEPAENAQILCAIYLADASRGRCRRMRAKDLRVLPAEVSQGSQAQVPASAIARGLSDCAGNRYRIALFQSRGGQKLRWAHQARSECGRFAPARALALRAVLGALESYEPALAHTRSAVALAAGAGEPAARYLQRELASIERSPYVLNRALREAVLGAVARGELTLGEIALRCGHVKRELGGAPGGETSWLARRIGLAPERAGGRRSPWIHSDLLALIARCGLGVDPREVETH